MMLAMEDVRAVLVKLACRVHNMRTLSGLSPEKQRLFAQETLDIFAVVANRLGCWCLKVRRCGLLWGNNSRLVLGCCVEMEMVSPC